MAGQQPVAEVQGEERYQNIRDLCHGANGKVYLVKDRQRGGQVVLKHISRHEDKLKFSERELLNHSILVHPHIVRLHDAYATHEYIALTMEYCNSGDLYELIKTYGTFTEDVARNLYRQLIAGLDYCHKMSICHRDIKLENLLLVHAEGTTMLKICDFGYSFDEGLSRATSLAGTLSSMAPEIRSNTGAGYDGKAGDIWSSGVVLFEMIFNFSPFGKNGDKLHRFDALRSLFRHGVYPGLPDKQISGDCGDLLSRIFVTEPRNRITLTDIKRHPWFCKGGLPYDIDEWNGQFISARLV